jgi:hypothetical protein
MIAGAAESMLPVLTPDSTNPANEVAKRLTGRDYISWSAISTFRTCPLKYKFRYIDGLTGRGWSGMGKPVPLFFRYQRSAVAFPPARHARRNSA